MIVTDVIMRKVKYYPFRILLRRSVAKADDLQLYLMIHGRDVLKNG